MGQIFVDSNNKYIIQTYEYIDNKCIVNDDIYTERDIDEWRYDKEKKEYWKNDEDIGNDYKLWATIQEIGFVRKTLLKLTDDFMYV